MLLHSLLACEKTDSTLVSGAEILLEPLEKEMEVGKLMRENGWFKKT